MNVPPSSDIRPHVVLGIAAHPDDLDFGASGTMAHYAAMGAEVYYLILTDGSKGSADPHMDSPALVKLREKEQRAAAKIIGAKKVFFLGYEDGALEVTQPLKKDIVRVIRRVKPDIVITMDPSVLYYEDRGFINHPDHRAAGQATLDAVFPLARDRLTYPDLIAEGLDPHKTATLLLINFDKQNFFVDISARIETKLTALRAHASQLPDLDLVRDWAATAGRANGTKYAEGFLRIDIPG